MNDDTDRIEEAFWGRIREEGREQLAEVIAQQILDKPHGQLDVGYLIPLAKAFLEKRQACTI